MQELWYWLVTPISGAVQHALDPRVAWHGRLMVLAWVILVPIAILLARFYKVTPRQHWPRQLDNRFWWHGHRWLNYSATALAALGLALVWDANTGTGTLHALHAWLGWSVLACCVLQLSSGTLRGSKGGPTDPRLWRNGRERDWHGDHYAMTTRRIVFEYLHKTVGYLCLLAIPGTVLVGLWNADAPRWMWLVTIAWWCGWSWVFVRLQTKGRCIDTYQAIWGPDPHHPGNRSRPIGWGIRRPIDVPSGEGNPGNGEASGPLR